MDKKTTFHSSSPVASAGAIGCGNYVNYASSLSKSESGRTFASQAGETVASTDCARVDKLGDGVWAVISTPGGGAQTFANGGIIAGEDATLIIEGFLKPEGARWVSLVAEALTGRPTTHVVLTHFHADHCAGLAGHIDARKPPAVIATKKTRELHLRRIADVTETPEGATMGVVGTLNVVPDHVIVDETRPTELNLGGRVIRLGFRKGHTQSDLTVEIEEPRVVFCGDLCFKGLFPYFGDAIPSAWGKHVKELLAEDAPVYVPGHGALSDAAGLRPFQDLLDHIEETARAAFKAGIPASETWESYKIPDALGVWAEFRDDLYEVAFTAWERDLKGEL